MSIDRLMEKLHRNSLELVLATGFLLIFGFFTAYPLSDGDFFWHIHSGQQIVADHRLPDRDAYSFTTDRFIVDQTDDRRISVILKQYWLAQIILFSLYTLLGTAGIVGLRVLVFAAILAVLYRWGRSRAPAPASAFFTILTAGLLIEYPTERPQLFTFLLAVVVMALLEKLRCEEGWRQGLAGWLLPPLMLLWGNLHGGYLLGVGFCLIYLVGYGLGALRDGCADRRYGLILLAAAFLPFVNPCGFDTLLSSLATDSDYLAMVYETMTPLAAFRHGDYFWGYWVVLILAIASLAVAHREMVFEHAMIVASLLILSFFGLRYMIFLIMCFPLFIGAYAKVRRRWSMAAVAGSLVIFLAGANFAEAGRAGLSPFFPGQATEFLRSYLPESRLFSHYDWGGYLGFMLPGSRVFIDGRGLVPEVVREYNAIKDAIDYDARLEQYGVEVIVMPGVGRTSGTIYPLVKALYTDARWQLVYQDDRALVFTPTEWGGGPVGNLGHLDKKRIFMHIISRVSHLLPDANDYEALALLQSKAESQMMLGDYAGARESCSAMLARDSSNMFAGRLLERLGRIR